MRYSVWTERSDCVEKYTRQNTLSHDDVHRSESQNTRKFHYQLVAQRFYTYSTQPLHVSAIYGHLEGVKVWSTCTVYIATCNMKLADKLKYSFYVIYIYMYVCMYVCIYIYICMYKLYIFRTVHRTIHM
jgi:hypothetical protein